MRPDLDRLAARLGSAPLTRFAPSPTGYLHLGHATNAVWVWGIARALGGRVLLRIEDHDRTRCRPELETALLEDLAWLGLEPDVGTPDELRSGPSPYRQSDRGPVYAAELARLEARGLTFRCECSRKDLARTEGDVAGEETRYPGRCRSRALPATVLGTRVAIDPGIERFEDARLGEREDEPASLCGDVLVRDRLGQWTYQFAVTVDDVRQGIDLVVRGEDLITSTGRQIRLARLLGRASAPVYLHHPLLMGPGGAKLSKANRDTGLRDLRAGGADPESVLGEATWRSGLLDQPRPVAAGELGELFRRGT